MSKVLRSVLALVVGCLLLSIAAVAVGTPVEMNDHGQSTIVVAENSTNYLAPADPSGQAYQRVGMDVSSASAVAAQRIQSEHERRTFEYRLQSVPADDRSEVAQEQLKTIRDRLDLLDRRQQALFNQFSRGEISGETLLQELVAIQILVETQSDLIEQTEQHANPSDEFRIQLETHQDALTAEKPVTDRARDALVGESDRTTVYLQAADNSLVLATVDGDRYIRQAVLLDERDIEGEDQFGDDLSPGGYSRAQERMEELYPWAYNLPDLQIGGDRLSVYSKIYQLGLSHPQGELTTYFDGATENVFHENQYLTVDTVPVNSTLSNSTEAGTLQVNLTRSAGPMRVSVEDETGVSIASTVEINGQVVGTMGAEGTLWTAQPSGGFNVTVTTPDDKRISVTHEPEN